MRMQVYQWTPSSDTPEFHQTRCPDLDGAPHILANHVPMSYTADRVLAKLDQRPVAEVILLLAATRAVEPVGLLLATTTAVGTSLRRSTILLHSADPGKSASGCVPLPQELSRFAAGATQARSG